MDALQPGRRPVMPPDADPGLPFRHSKRSTLAELIGRIGVAWGLRKTHDAEHERWMTSLDMNGVQAAQVIVFAAAAGFVGMRFVPSGWRQRFGIVLLITYLAAAAVMAAWFLMH